MQEEKITCGNCSKELCTLKFQPNEDVLKVTCKCPLCGDKSLLTEIHSDRFTYSTPDNLKIIDMDFDIKKKKVVIHAKKVV